MLVSLVLLQHVLRRLKYLAKKRTKFYVKMRKPSFHRTHVVKPDAKRGGSGEYYFVAVNPKARRRQRRHVISVRSVIPLYGYLLCSPCLISPIAFILPANAQCRPHPSPYPPAYPASL